MNRIVIHIALACLAIGLAACGSAPVPPIAPVASVASVAPGSPLPSPAPASPVPAAVKAPVAAPSSAVASVALPAHLDPKSDVAAQQSVYFDFDVFALRGEDIPLIERHGKYLASRPSLSIRVEGNTDERGGVEYNLALGQKRAESVRRALRIYGVREGQMEAVSWGESRPRSSARDEAAWAQNRRADLRYPTR